MNTFKVPDDWTPAQALAVYELISALRESIWEHHGLKIQEQLQTERRSKPDIFDDDSDGEFNDEIPF
jgi:hypothetical protein